MSMTKQDALEVMGLNDQQMSKHETELAAQKNLTAIYHKLALKHHPDKFRDPGKKAEANENFQKLLEAYTLLQSEVTSRFNQGSNKNARGNQYSATETRRADTWFEERNNLINEFDMHVRPPVRAVYAGFNNSRHLTLRWSAFEKSTVSSWEAINQQSEMSTKRASGFGMFTSNNLISGSCDNYEGFLKTCLTNEKNSRIKTNDFAFRTGHVVVCCADVPLMKFAEGEVEYNPALDKDAIVDEIDAFLDTPKLAAFIRELEMDKNSKEYTDLKDSLQKELQQLTPELFQKKVASALQDKNRADYWKPTTQLYASEEELKIRKEILDKRNARLGDENRDEQRTNADYYPSLPNASNTEEKCTNWGEAISQMNETDLNRAMAQLMNLKMEIENTGATVPLCLEQCLQFATLRSNTKRSSLEGLLELTKSYFQQGLSHDNLVECVMHSEDQDSLQALSACCEKSVQSVLKKVDDRIEILRDRSQGTETASERATMIAKLRDVKKQSKALTRQLHCSKTVCDHAGRQSPQQDERETKRSGPSGPSGR